MVLGQIQRLARLLQILWSAVSKEKMLEIKFYNLLKAFDTVSHDILADKLRFYGLNSSAVCLVKSYLSQRYQVVYYRNYYFQNASVKIFGAGEWLQCKKIIVFGQKSHIRTICNNGKRTHHNPQFRKLKILTVPSLFILACLLYQYDIN